MSDDLCAKCGNILVSPRKLLKFCSYACRGQHAVAENDAAHGEAYKGSKNLRRNRALRSLKRRSVGIPTFEQINAVTYRIQTSKRADAAGWLMDVGWGGSAWVACVDARRSSPMALEAAKRAAIAMLRDPRLDVSSPAKCNLWPIDLLGVVRAVVGGCLLAHLIGVQS